MVTKLTVQALALVSQVESEEARRPMKKPFVRLVVGVSCVVALFILFMWKPWRAVGETFGAIGVGILAAIICAPFLAGVYWAFFGGREHARK